MKGQKLTIDVSAEIFPILVLLHLLSLQELAVLQVVNKSADKVVRHAVKEGIIKPTLPPYAMSPEYQKSSMAFVQWRIKNFIATDSMCFEGMHQPSMAHAVRKLFEMEALKSVTFKRSSLLVESLATTLKDTKLNDQTLFRSRNIQSLDFRECHTLTDSITTIFEVCPNLKTIKLSQCNQVSDDALLCLSTSCTQLESINLRYNTNITRKKDFNSITGFCALLQNCRDLREIKYIGITNYDIHPPIAEYCKQLESITLYFPYLKDDGIVALADSCIRIRHASFSWCKNITDEGLNAVTKWQHLQYLNVSNCSKISDDGVTTVTHSCHKLETIKLRSCSKITSKAVIALAENCTRLLNLDVSQTAVEKENVSCVLLRCLPSCRVKWTVGAGES
jgi:hypothetical protein